MSLQQELYIKRAGLVTESSEQLEESWDILLEKSSEFDGNDINYLLQIQEEISNLLEALPKAAYVSAMRNATDPEHGDADKADRIVKRAAKHHGAKFASNLHTGADKMHFGKPNRASGYDKLSYRGKPRVTKSGKANKQDISALKSRIKSGY